MLHLMDQRNWQTDEDLARVYITWSGYAYTGADTGVEAASTFVERLKEVSVAVKNQDNREHDIFDSDDYFQEHGGMIACVRALTGKNPTAYFGDSANPEQPKVRTLAEEAARVFRTRVVNPKWIHSVMRHGYKGAFEMAATHRLSVRLRRHGAGGAGLDVRRRDAGLFERPRGAPVPGGEKSLGLEGHGRAPAGGDSARHVGGAHRGDDATLAAAHPGYRRTPRRPQRAGADAMLTPPLLPFTAIVGQEPMKRALVLNAIYPAIGGVLISGEKGTAKSTAVRALAALLPEIAVVADCPYSCDPERPDESCMSCQDRRARGESLPVTRRQVRMVELPVGATEDRMLGTIDVEAALQDGTYRFEPGLLAAAHRGILYVDEVNLLPDHLVDALLDVAASGVNVVEREGISFAHPARFMLVGTMNPEEGELRPQLLDRFGITAEVLSLRDPELRYEVVRRRLAFERDPGGFRRTWEAANRRKPSVSDRRRLAWPQVQLDERLARSIADICAAAGVDGLRGDLVIHKAAMALAAYAGRRQVTEEDVQEAVVLALAHRRRRRPFEPPVNSPPRFPPPQAQRTPPTATTGDGAATPARAGQNPRQQHAATRIALTSTASFRLAGEDSGWG